MQDDSIIPRHWYVFQKSYNIMFMSHLLIKYIRVNQKVNLKWSLKLP